ncbi:MAG: hypothetical protein SGJ01_14445 [Gemmatimonadota bacterium]|nr:hypothetical protein [Gemmatimonadota bacterium]
MRQPLQQAILVTVLLGAGTPAVAAQTVTELYVTPDTVRLEAGKRQGLGVQAFDDAGNAVLAINYRTADSLVARIASNGTITAGRAGRTQLMVEAGRKSRSVLVIVTGGAAAPAAAVATAAPAAVASPTLMSAPINEVGLLVAEPAGIALLPTERGRVNLRAFKVDGTPATGPVRLVWKSLRPDIVTVNDSTGVVTALATGTGVVQAIAPGGTSLTIPVTVSLAEWTLDETTLVLSPQDTDTLRATVATQGGRRLRGEDLQWSVSDPSVLAVSPEGIVQALAPGRAELVAQGFLQQRYVSVVVHQRVARFLTAPRLTEPVRMLLRSSREFTLIPQTADSLPVEGVDLRWSVGDTMIARFDVASSQLTALQPGMTMLSFAARGFLPKAWTIEVLPGAISLGRSRVALRPGDTTSFSPQLVDDQGRPVAPATGLAWVTSNAGVARVTADGTVYAMAPGRATITAQAPGGVPAEVTILVTGDLLVASTRGGRFGVYALLLTAPETFIPILADSATNTLDAVYSPDRTRLAFASDRAGAGNYDIYLADADGRNAVRLTTDPGLDFQPAWTPDGTHLVFVSTRTGVRQLHIMAADGSEARALTALPGGAEEPSLSSDGQRVAFTGYPGKRDEPSDIYTVAITGGPLNPVTRTPDRREMRPVFLSGGELSWVLLRRDRKDPDLILRQASPGAPTAQFVSSALALQDVAFAPDGSRLAWVASRPAEHNRPVPEFTLQWRLLSSGAETSVRLLPGERITSPAF